MTALQYTKIFDPPETYVPPEFARGGGGDDRANPPYVFDDDVVLRINVALATGRPLLVRGEPGTGKSTLARATALCMQRRYYEEVITSRTQASDLLWTVDLVQRLHDAQAAAASKGEAKFDPSMWRYVQPEVLWWAFDSGSAKLRGRKASEVPKEQRLSDPCEDFEGAPAVVLLDEIDKADPDVPNNLLVPLGAMTFDVDEVPCTVSVPGAGARRRKNAPLVFLTTNNERKLPDAFLRRCVELELSLPTAERLVAIGATHFGDSKANTVQAVLLQLIGRDKAEWDEVRGEVPGLSPAEFLDTLRALDGLKISGNKRTPAAMNAISGVTVFKHGRRKLDGGRAEVE